MRENLVRDPAAPEHLFAFLGDFVVPRQVDIVVCPHQIKLHFFAVGRAEEAAVEGVFEEWFVFVPVPVENHDVDAVRCRKVDFFCHDRGVGFVFVAEQRHARLVVSFVLGLRFVDVLPFALAVSENAEFRPARFGVVGGPVVCGDVVVLLFLRG